MISAAWPYVVSMVALAALIFLFGHVWIALPPLLAAVGVAFFFRDPERRVPADQGLVTSPADGRVVEIDQDRGTGRGRIGIFLSLFDVHVNRSPVSGTVRNVTYRPGAFRPAYERSASAVNERNTLEMDSDRGSFDVSQIAGIIARRIRCFKKAGDRVERGERIGYIAFGSRTELTLPPGAEIVVRIGDSVRGGETVVARFKAPGGSAT